MTTVLGIDPSVAATGIAVWRTGVTYTLTAATEPTEDITVRWRHILRKVWRECDPRTLMVIENLPYGRQDVSGLFVERAGLLALLRYGAAARAAPVALVNPLTVKKYATGYGRATKKDMRQSANVLLGRSTANDNEADALWLLMMALQHYGHLAISLPSTQARCVEAVQWPKWEA